jgi:hypothetical protein
MKLTMKTFTPRLISSIAATCLSFGALATTTFNPANSQLSIDAILLGGAVYKNVGVTINDYVVNSVGSGAPGNNSFDPASSLLTLGAISVQGVTYNNVSVGIKSYSLIGATPAGSAAICSAPQYFVVGINACVTPMGTKVSGPNTIYGETEQSQCYRTTDACWAKYVAKGAVKFIATSATSPGAKPDANSQRPIVFAYFTDYVNVAPGATSPLYWNIVPMYADTAEVANMSLGLNGGSTSEVDWVVGTADGLVSHNKASGLCYLKNWVPSKNGWNDDFQRAPVACP